MNQTTTTNILTHFPALAMSLQQRDAIVQELAHKWVEDGHQHDSLSEAAEHAAGLCKGLDEPFEIKKLFRQYVRQLRG